MKIIAPVAAQGLPCLPMQPDLFEAQTQWFHLFKAMIDSGDLARIPGSAVKVYLVIKAHTNYQTGCAFPKLETIATKSGISLAQVKREINVLEKYGYITKTRVGRRNEYRLREKVEIRADDGRPAAVATWDYLPSTVQRAVADLKNVLVSGDLGGARVVHIERLQVNVNHLHDNAVNFNVQEFMANLDQLPEELRNKLTACWSASRIRKNEGRE
ncbi:helix-turn-helix domain-containing protein [Aromatoleum aromaticum]|nr:helix-turn-helix domain-containing protein [Aromatoleum aromaticum]